MDAINLGADDGLPTVDWQAVAETLAGGHPPEPGAHNTRSTWLTTVNADGSPHTTPVGAAWVDGAYWFQTGATTRKHRNLDRDPRCSVAQSIRGADVVVEGEARRVTDPDLLARVVAAWSGAGWPAEVDPSGEGITAPFNAPAQGPPPWHVYRLDAGSAVVVLGDEPGGLTRFRF